MKQSKQEINYRLPEQCCGNCIRSYFSHYDDTCCELLAHHDLIDVGGICDNYSPAPIMCSNSNINEQHNISNTSIEEEKIKNCSNCKHSCYIDYVATCDVDGSEIENPEDCCSAWDEDYNY